MTGTHEGRTEEREGNCHKCGAYGEAYADEPTHPGLDVLDMLLKGPLHRIKNGHNKKLQTQSAVTVSRRGMSLRIRYLELSLLAWTALET